MMVTVGEPRRLGVPEADARLRFEARRRSEGKAETRMLTIDGKSAFQLSHWCGTCPLLFERLEGSWLTLSLERMQQRLAGELTELDEGVLEVFGSLLPEADYLPLLLRIEPRLTVPGKEGDYFSREQVATWGLDQFWGLPQHPRTPYYRTFETAVDETAHLYEFVVPMVPPTWNERDRVEQYVEGMGRGAEPTAVAVSTLDVCQSSLGLGADDHTHWGLTHFLLDGHHKLEAAAAVGRPVRLLALVALREGVGEEPDHRRLAKLRDQPHQGRAARQLRTDL